MNPPVRAALAAHLTSLLPGLDLSGTGPLALLDGAPRPGATDADLHLALLAEVRALVESDDALGSAVRGHAGADQLHPLLDDVLARNERHAETLWALLGGERPAPGAHGVGGGRFTRLRRAAAGARRALSREGLLARGVAALLMNVLVLGTAAVVVAVFWGGVPSGTTRQDLTVDLLKLFALWCLSFLPGWLYARFLGQRAGALWNEYVLNLHRLGWDQPGFLPRPPAASAYFREWLAGGGPLYNQRTNIYRQKFDAYYGRALVDGVQGSNFAVRVDTMFPVFLATAVLAVGWTTVLWDPRFLVSPSSIWDVLRFAFLGAYSFILQSLVRRFFQSDLRPSAYAAAVLRVIVVLLVMTALHQLLTVDRAVTGAVEAAVAFVIGIFPIVALQALQRLTAGTLRVAVPQLSPDYPLNQLDGLNIWYEARLLEEGIEDMQNLATANLVDVILHTRVPVGRLIDWVDQAALYVHLDRAERGWGERRLVRGARRTETKLARAAVQHAAPGTPLPETAPPPDSAPKKPDRTSGSVNYAARAGTRTRVALRQVGIRTATDLLKAFPPETVDPGPRSRPAREPALPDSLDLEQVRTLVRVLDEDVDLAPVWNWQARGVTAHDEQRMPRSVRRNRPGQAAPAPPPAPGDGHLPRHAADLSLIPRPSDAVGPAPAQPDGTGSSSP